MNFIKSAVKFLPVIVLAGLMISGPRMLIAAPIAAIAAVIVAKDLPKNSPLRTVLMRLFPA